MSTPIWVVLIHYVHVSLITCAPVWPLWRPSSKECSLLTWLHYIYYTIYPYIHFEWGACNATFSRTHYYMLAVHAVFLSSSITINTFFVCSLLFYSTIPDKRIENVINFGCLVRVVMMKAYSNTFEYTPTYSHQITHVARRCESWMLSRSSCGSLSTIRHSTSNVTSNKHIHISILCTYYINSVIAMHLDAVDAIYTLSIDGLPSGSRLVTGPSHLPFVYVSAECIHKTSLA